MIKFGIRDYHIDSKIITDRVVAYTMDDKEIPFDTDMSKYIGTVCMFFHFDESGKLIEKYYSELISITRSHDSTRGLDTWSIWTANKFKSMKDLDRAKALIDKKVKERLQQQNRKRVPKDKDW
jgi:hypothetical protein